MLFKNFGLCELRIQELLVIFMVILIGRVEANKYHQSRQQQQQNVYHSPEAARNPYFRSSKSIQQAKVKERVRFECDVANLGKNLITWHNLTSGRILYAGPINVFQDERLETSNDGKILIIQDITEFDSGPYKCQVETKYQPISLEHHLNVLVPPRVYPSPPDGNYVVRSGSDIGLVCHAEGSPRPKIVWRRKEGNLGLLPSGEREVSSNVLNIHGVDRFDVGLYECTAENGVGSPAAAGVKLQVIYPPIVEVKRHKVYAEPGQRAAELECLVFGDPKPEVSWKHQTNGQRPTDNRDSRLTALMDGDNKSVLQIKQIDERDYGIYECRAQNSEGFAMGEVELTGEPQKPEILSPEDSDRLDSYTLIWAVLSPYKIIQQKVNYWELRDESPSLLNAIETAVSQPGSYFHPKQQQIHNPRNEIHLNSHEQAQLSTDKVNEIGMFPERNKYLYEIVLPELKPYTKYAVQVRSTSKFSEGEWSELFTFETSGKVRARSTRWNSGLTSSATAPSGIFENILGMNHHLMSLVSLTGISILLGLNRCLFFSFP